MFCLASAFRSCFYIRIRLVRRQFGGIISTNESVRKPVNCVAFHRLNYDSFGTWMARNFLAKRYQLHVDVFFPRASRSSSAIAHTYFLHRLPFSTHRSAALPTWRFGVSSAHKSSSHSGSLRFVLAHFECFQFKNDNRQFIGDDKTRPTRDELIDDWLCLRNQLEKSLSLGHQSIVRWPRRKCFHLRSKSHKVF